MRPRIDPLYFSFDAGRYNRVNAETGAGAVLAALASDDPPAGTGGQIRDVGSIVFVGPRL